MRIRSLVETGIVIVTDGVLEAELREARIATSQTVLDEERIQI